MIEDRGEARMVGKMMFRSVAQQAQSEINQEKEASIPFGQRRKQSSLSAFK
jgi:hypothetical protein